MNLRSAALVLLFVFLFAVPHSVLAHWECAFRYNCVKKHQFIKHFGKLNGRFLFVLRSLSKKNMSDFSES